MGTDLFALAVDLIHGRHLFFVNENEAVKCERPVDLYSCVTLDDLTDVILKMLISKNMPVTKMCCELNMI